MAKTNKCLSVYFSAVALLHVACKTSRNGFNEELMYILTTILGRNFSHCCRGFLSWCVSEPGKSELVEFLQRSAVEHLTTFRQLMSGDFSSVAVIVTTDFEALYAYKRGDYQQCLQLCTQNVLTLMHRPTDDMSDEVSITYVPTYPEFVQLMDDDIASLIALMLIINPTCRLLTVNSSISQLTLSLYLMTQCKLKLRHLCDVTNSDVSDVTPSLTQTLALIKVGQLDQSCERTLDQLTLKLIERKAHLEISPVAAPAFYE